MLILTGAKAEIAGKHELNGIDGPCWLLERHRVVLAARSAESSGVSSRAQMTAAERRDSRDFGFSTAIAPQNCKERLGEDETDDEVPRLAF